MLLRKAATLGLRAVQSPVTTKLVRGARTAAEIANLAGLPTAGLAKGLGVAEKVLSSIQKD